MAQPVLLKLYPSWTLYLKVCSKKVSLYLCYNFIVIYIFFHFLESLLVPVILHMIFIYILHGNMHNIVSFIFLAKGENMLEIFYLSIQNSSPLCQLSLTFHLLKISLSSPFPPPVQIHTHKQTHTEGYTGRMLDFKK